ncbi:MAG TPA: FAD:protein FMN transferase [Opitutus sp.]|nr:FAD:protein FMN transferase [Opitutus sp.]
MALVVSSHSHAPAAVAAGTADSLRRLSFAAMGTSCEIQYACAGADSAARFEQHAAQWVQAFEAKYSRFRPDSLVSRINAAAGREWVPVDAEMEQMFKLCDTLHFLTQGILDPTLLPLIQLWNYKVEHPALPSESDVTAARKLVGWAKVRREPGRVFLPEAGMSLDFGGFGKEYAVDVVAQIALEHGIKDVLVDFGHDLRALGRPPGRPAWHIGLESPHRPGTTDGSMAFAGNRGVASSGDYLRKFVFEGRRFGHIIDPRTGWPVANGCLQATVVANTCLHAGVLSTTAFVLGVPKGIEFIQSFPGAEGLIVTERARAQTRGFYQYVVAG